MAGLLVIGLNSVQCIASVSFSNAGINPSNCDAIYEINPDGSGYIEYNPNSATNEINSFTVGRFYLVYMRVGLDLSAYVTEFAALTQKPLLIVFAGESGSGGIASNSDATAEELAPRKLKIFNNITNASFDPLDIGVNNELGQVAFDPYIYTKHGWELELANKYEAGNFGYKRVYLTKAGQGGTQVRHWAPGATYSALGSTVEPLAKLVQRVKASIALIEAEHKATPDVVLFWSLGINDGLESKDPTTWKANVKALFLNIRLRLGIPLPIYMMRFEFTAANYYATQINEIGQEVPYVTVVTSAGLTTIPDGIHLDYAGNKGYLRNVVPYLPYYSAQPINPDVLDILDAVDEAIAFQASKLPVITRKITSIKGLLAKRVVRFSDIGITNRNTAIIKKITPQGVEDFIPNSTKNTFAETELDGQYIIIPTDEVELSEDDFKIGS